jgi:cytochrome c oxidase assembly protein subunit 15
VAIWILVGIFMLIVQVLLGGITRLTGSGLSITEWNLIMGVLPPMNDQEWNIAFEKYKGIAQYKFLNSHFTLADFKSIFFWEWFHRLWARLIAVAFLVPFIVFLVQKRFRPEMVRPLVILFLLGALQGLVGWIMVLSGLEDSELIYVSHYKLAIHFVLALGLICYALWFAVKLLVPTGQVIVERRLRVFGGWLVAILVVQLIYGAFMAGLKAATSAPTWPTINGAWWPADFRHFGNKTYTGISFLFDHPLVVHFIHRNLAYLLAAGVLGWTWVAFRVNGSGLFSKARWLPLCLVLVQVLLGILTVLNSVNNNSFTWLAVSHQFVAMMLLLSLVLQLYIIRAKKAVPM